MATSVVGYAISTVLAALMLATVPFLLRGVVLAEHWSVSGRDTSGRSLRVTLDLGLVGDRRGVAALQAWARERPEIAPRAARPTHLQTLDGTGFDASPGSPPDPMER